MVSIVGREVRFGPAIIGSLVGTVLFGMMMQMMGMMGMIAMLVKSESIIVGWAVHMVVGTLLGVGFAVFAAIVPLPAWLNGLVYAMGVWVLGPLIIMPVWLGMPNMVLDLTTSTPWFSLMGHMVWGFIMGLLYGKIGLGSFTARTNLQAPARA